MSKISTSIKGFLLFLWDRLPIPKRIRWHVLNFLSHKYLVGVLAIIQDDEGRILLFKHSYNNPHPWFLPGGFVKFENLEEALQREIKEESNFDIEVKNPIAIVRNEKNRLTHVFKATIVGGSFKPSAEVIDFGFFFRENLQDIGETSLEILQTIGRKSGNEKFINRNFKGYFDIKDLTSTDEAFDLDSVRIYTRDERKQKGFRELGKSMKEIKKSPVTEQRQKTGSQDIKINLETGLVSFGIRVANLEPLPSFVKRLTEISDLEKVDRSEDKELNSK